MNCNQIRELLPELAAGMDAATPEVENHIASCAACAAHLDDLRKTMALLDEWQAPEPSPYFDTRLRGASARRNGAPGCGMARLAAASGVGYVGGWRSACRSTGRWYWHRRQVVYLRFRNDPDQTSISQSAGAAGDRGRRLAGAGEKRRVVRRFRCARRTAGTGRRDRKSVRIANEDLRTEICGRAGDQTCWDGRQLRDVWQRCC